MRRYHISEVTRLPTVAVHAVEEEYQCLGMRGLLQVVVVKTVAVVDEHVGAGVLLVVEDGLVAGELLRCEDLTAVGGAVY